MSPAKVFIIMLQSLFVSECEHTWERNDLNRGQMFLESSSIK